jgi:hypothetical protein
MSNEPSLEKLILNAFNPKPFRKPKEQIERDFKRLGYESVKDYIETKDTYDSIAARFGREPMPNHWDISCQSVDESGTDIFERCEHVQKEFILEKIKQFRQESVKNLFGESQLTTVKDVPEAKAGAGRPKNNSGIKGFDGSIFTDSAKKQAFEIWKRRGCTDTAMTLWNAIIEAMPSNMWTFTREHKKNTNKWESVIDSVDCEKITFLRYNGCTIAQGTLSNHIKDFKKVLEIEKS